MAVNEGAAVSRRLHICAPEAAAFPHGGCTVALLSPEAATFLAYADAYVRFVVKGKHRLFAEKCAKVVLKYQVGNCCRVR